MKNFFLLLTLVLTSGFALANKNNVPDYEKFGSLPMVSLPDLSPDGKYIAALLNSPDGPTVVISEFGNTELTPILKLKKSLDRIDNIAWANNERILVTSSYSKPYYGDRTRVSRLYAINRDGSNLQEIRRKTIGTSDWTNIFDTSEVLSYLPNDPAHVLIQLYDERDKAFSVFKVDIDNNDFEKLFVNSYDVRSWVADKNGDILFGYGFDDNDKDIMHIWYRSDVTKPFSKLKSVKSFADETFNPVMLVKAETGDKVIVISDHELKRDAVWQYDINSQSYEQLIYAADGFDISSVIYNKERNKIIGVKYIDNYVRTHYLDESDAQQDVMVKNSFKKYETYIASRSKDRNKLLVAAVRDNTPIKYFWLDLNKRAGGFWFSQYPHLESEQLANVQPFNYKAKDGMELHGYLTLPVNLKNNSKPKLVVLPHGGPQSRDYQYFNQFVQFFAHKGYAVLQMNFRGSTGYGNDYQTAGYREWGKNMQNDVYDAIDWLTQQGTVDTKQACLVGASYGGYVALTAAFQQPERFQCVISIAGISDLPELVKKEFKYKTKRAFLRETIGDLEDENNLQAMESVSAIKHIERIKSPILLIHGDRDTRVHVTQSQEFYDKAKAKKRDINYVELEYGTHFLDENENRILAFKEIGSFLSKHL